MINNPPVAPRAVYRNRMHSDNMNRRNFVVEGGGDVAGGAEPFMYHDDDETGTKFNINGLSQAGYWAWLNPILYLLAFVPGFGFGLYGTIVAGLPGLCGGFGAGGFFVYAVLLNVVLR